MEKRSFVRQATSARRHSKADAMCITCGTVWHDGDRAAGITEVSAEEVWMCDTSTSEGARARKAKGRKNLQKV